LRANGHALVQAISQLLEKPNGASGKPSTKKRGTASRER
jgi:hypothetical protein